MGERINKDGALLTKGNTENSAPADALGSLTWRMKFQKRTELLERDLQSASSYEDFLAKNSNELASWSLPSVLKNISQSPPLMESFSAAPGLSDTDKDVQGQEESGQIPTANTIIENARLNRSFYYQILNGVKDPSRDVLICLALALRCGLDAANELLRYGMFPGLYVRDRRDAVLISCIVHKKTLPDTDQALKEAFIPVLRTRKAVRTAAEIGDREFRYSTDEFTEMLCKTLELRNFMAENETEFLGNSFTDNLNRLLKIRGKMESGRRLRSTDVIARSRYIPENTGFQYFNGGRIPSRNKAILLGFGLDCTPDELQQLLRSSGNAALYVRFERDCIIYKCRAMGFDAMKTEQCIQEHFMDKYRGRGFSRSEAEAKAQEQLLSREKQTGASHKAAITQIKR